MANVAGSGSASASGGKMTINVAELTNIAPAVNQARSTLSEAKGILSGITIPSDFSGAGAIRSAISSISDAESQLNSATSGIATIIRDYAAATRKNDIVIDSFGTISKKSKKDRPNRLLSQEDIEKYYLNGAISTRAGGNTGSARESLEEVKRTWANIQSASLGFAHGVGEFGENVDDTLEIVTSGIATPFTALYDIAQGKDPTLNGSVTSNMWKDTMGFVAEERVNNFFEDFYKNNQYGQWLRENANEKFLPGGSIYEFSKGLGYTGGTIALGGVLGGTPLAMGFAGGIAGFGKGTQEYWAEARDKANGREWRTLDTGLKGLGYGFLNGGWEGVQWYAGAKLAKIPSISVGSRTINVTSKARVAFDTAFNAADTPYRSAVASLMNGTSFKTEFERRGGWQAVGTNVAIGAILSSLGEYREYRNDKYIERNIESKVRTENTLNDIRAIKGKFNNIEQFRNASLEKKAYIINHIFEISKNTRRDIRKVLEDMGHSYWASAQQIVKNELNSFARRKIKTDALQVMNEFFSSRKKIPGVDYYSPQELEDKLKFNIILYDSRDEFLKARNAPPDSGIQGFNRGGKIHLPPEASILTTTHEFFHSLGGFRDDETTRVGFNESTTELLAREATGTPFTSPGGYPESTMALHKIKKQLNKVTGDNLILNAYIRGDIAPIKNVMDSIWRKYSGYDGQSIFDRINSSMARYNKDFLHTDVIELERDRKLFEKAMEEFLRSNKKAEV